MAMGMQAHFKKPKNPAGQTVKDLRKRDREVTSDSLPGHRPELLAPLNAGSCYSGSMGAR
jgi:hypothetical protein